MKKKLTFVHLFLLNQLVTTLVLLTVLGVYGTHLFIQEQRAIRERMEPASAREVDRINNDFATLEANVQRLKSMVELFDVMPKGTRVEKFRQFASATIAGHSTQFNAWVALGPRLAKEYLGRESYVYVVHRDYSLFASPKYNDPTTFVAEVFTEPGYDKDPDVQWWWMNEKSSGVNYSDFYFDKGYMEKVMFSTTTGIFSNAGKLEAVVGIDTLAGDIAHRLGIFKLGDTGGALVVDEHGRPVLPLIAKDTPVLGFKYLRALNQDEFRAMPKLSQKVFNIQNQRQLQEFPGADGKTYLTYSRPIKGKPWHLVIYQEKGEAYSGLYFRLFFFGFVALVAYVVFTLMVWMTGKYVIAQDKEALARLQDSRDRAEAATRAKSLFLSTMSHEIRTPLNAMLGSAELLNETHLNFEQRELLISLQSAGDTLLSMLNNILDFSKFESGRMQLESREFLLSDLVREVQALISTSVLRKNLQFTFHPPEHDRWIVGDSLRLKQVLMNLLGNAVKFTDRGAIELTVQPYPGSEPGKETIFFEVKDTGIGIAKENLKKVFDEFGQEDSSVTRRFGGTGLGLSISQKIVQLMGGELYCESRQFVGSRFHFSVQMTSRRAELWSARFNLELTPPPQLVRPSSEAGRKSILIVDDMEENHTLLKAYIKRLEYVTTDSAYNGYECLEMWERGHYDMIFMDVQMPKMSGLDTIRKLREIERARGLHRTPVVVISANSFTEDIEKSLMAGADQHCGKPVRKQTVLEIVQKYCSEDIETAPANS
ncbi:Sensor histidine kinase RcsC [Bdellovibrio bacteriovorus]|uniref:hybrid sensor histidine kinase/response regulator n=1 Tax=Bdellovibrio bacteriovorus TaxID=959 RepID=UPI00045C0832|nr:hybrid sensor histidine kinase/response regulator [Bdellovibrio bacteriovorus]AHZ86111.1 histidine kinase [Bdellovibrio bacteriovorus]BEV67036.1 Sensor histidine kinase RcsC [Bdellovibrio bacteriovorus]